jgi:hypothetical protein
MKQNCNVFSYLCLALISAFCLSSCGTYPIDDPYYVDKDRQKENLYYVPVTPNTPILSKSQDMNFSVNRSSNEKFIGVEAHAAYLPSDHFGIIGSYASMNNDNLSGDVMSYSHIEGGVGYIKEISPAYHFEAYAGAGTGKIHNEHHTGTSNIGITNFFVQPTFAFTSKDKNIMLGFTSRFAGVHFNVMDTSFNTDRENFSAGQISSLYATPFHVMFEPGITVKAGWKNFMFQSSYFYSADLTNPDLYRVKGNFSIGIALRFNLKENLSKAKL